MMKMMEARTSSWLALDALEDAGIMTSDDTERFRHDLRGKVYDRNIWVAVDSDTLSQVGTH